MVAFVIAKADNEKFSAVKIPAEPHGNALFIAYNFGHTVAAFGVFVHISVGRGLGFVGLLYRTLVGVVARAASGKAVNAQRDYESCQNCGNYRKQR